MLYTRTRTTDPAGWNLELSDTDEYRCTAPSADDPLPDAVPLLESTPPHRGAPTNADIRVWPRFGRYLLGVGDGGRGLDEFVGG